MPNMSSMFITFVEMMFKAVLTSVLFVSLVNGEGTLSSLLSDPQATTTDAMRKTAAREYSTQRLADRTAQHDAIRSAGKLCSWSVSSPNRFINDLW